MAISTYSELQTAVSNWLAGQVDSDRIPEFIELAEAAMSRLLYPNEAETATSTSTTSGVDYVSLPSDCRAVRDVSLDESGRRGLDYAPPNAWRELGTTGSGKPSLYTIEGTRVRFSPVPDDAYSVAVLYQQGLTPLSASVDSNEVFPQHADAYLYGALQHAYDFLMDETRAAKFKGKFEEAMAQVYLEFQRVRFPGPLRRRSTYREMR